MRGDEPLYSAILDGIAAEFPACAGMNRLIGSPGLVVVMSSPHARG